MYMYIYTYIDMYMHRKSEMDKQMRGKKMEEMGRIALVCANVFSSIGIVYACVGLMSV